MGCFSRSIQWYICFSEYVWRSEYMALSTSLNFMSYESLHASYSCSRIGLFVVVFGFPKRTKNTHTHSDGLTIQALNCTAEIKQNPVRAVVWQFHLRTIYWCWCYTVLNWCMLICWYIVFLLGVDIFHVDFHVEIGQSNMFTVCLLAPAIGSRRISGSRTIARREVAAKLQRTTHRGTWHAATRGQHAGVESRMRDLAMWLHIIHVMLYTYVYLFFYVIYVFVFFVYTHV